MARAPCGPTLVAGVTRKGRGDLAAWGPEAMGPVRLRLQLTVPTA